MRVGKLRAARQAARRAISLPPAPFFWRSASLRWLPQSTHKQSQISGLLKGSSGTRCPRMWVAISGATGRKLPSAATLIAANAARCRLIALKISPRTIGHRRASSMTNGVASAQGSQEINTIKNGRSQALPTPTKCMVRSVWLASNNPAAHQMAAIQAQPVKRAFARALVMTNTLHQVRGEGPELRRMAVLLQRAVLIASALANTLFATSNQGEINE